MDIRLIFRNHQGGAKGGRSVVSQPLNGLRCQALRATKDGGKAASGARDVMAGERARSDRPRLPRKAPKREAMATVPQTDTGGQVENTKALERTLVKELGKMAP